MDKYVIPTFIRLNKSKAFLDVVPSHCPCCSPPRSHRANSPAYQYHHQQRHQYGHLFHFGFLHSRLRRPTPTALRASPPPCTNNYPNLLIASDQSRERSEVSSCPSPTP